MNNLIIDCSAGMSLILIKGEEIFSFVDENEKRHTDDLLVKLDDLLIKANLKISDIDKIGVCVGPGSFTGVRVAISICKGLAIGAGADVFVLTNFDCYELDKNKIIVLEGFSKFIYTRKLINGKFVDLCEDVQEFKDSLKESFVGYEIIVPNEKVQNFLKKYEINSNIAKNNIISAFNQKFVSGDKIELNQISPVYLRASQAEIERDKKLKGNV